MRTTTDIVRHRRWAILGGAVALWAVACVGGLVGLARYQAAAGAPAAVAARWPAGSRLHRATDADTLVVIVHPRCPCSRATIDDLAVLLAHCPPGRVRTTVLFVRPPGVPAGWERTALWDAAAAIPGVTVLADDEGREAAAFGATTSGQAALYDPAGRRIFAGGLTPGRGHVGDSGGAAAVRAAAAGEETSDAATPVYGCPLRTPPADGGATCPR